MMGSDVAGLGSTIVPMAGGPPRAIAVIEIVLAYRQPVVRSGLGMLLDGVEGFEVVAEVADARSARVHLSAHHARVLVLDLDQAGGTPAAAIASVRMHSPQTRIVVMSDRQDHAFVRETLAAGALGYVPSTAAANELSEAVRRAASSETYISAGLGPQAGGPTSPVGPSELSRREVEVLGLLAVGHTNPEIAERLFLSVRTIETHRAHIRHKLECLTRAELVAYAFENGLGLPRQSVGSG